MTIKTWTVELTLDEEGDDTYADAVLSMDQKTEVRGRGVSRRNPHDALEPRIGDELAAARALADLADHLRDATADDIEARTHQRPRSLQL